MQQLRMGACILSVSLNHYYSPFGHHDSVLPSPCFNSNTFPHSSGYFMNFNICYMLHYAIFISIIFFTISQTISKGP